MYAARRSGVLFFFFMLRRPPRSTLFPTRRSSDLPLALRQLAFERDQQVLGFLLFDEQVGVAGDAELVAARGLQDRKSTRLNSSHMSISYAVFCLKKKKQSQHLLILAHTRELFHRS